MVTEYHVCYSLGQELSGTLEGSFLAVEGWRSPAGHAFVSLVESLGIEMEVVFLAACLPACLPYTLGKKGLVSSC